MRMLVVDDEVTVLWLRERLEPRGFEVRGTPSGDDALYLSESEGPWDMVLTELWIMPGKKIRSGFELVKAIRSASVSQRIAIYTNDKGLLATQVPVMGKPCRIDHLLRILRQPVLPLGAPSKGKNDGAH